MALTLRQDRPGQCITAMAEGRTEACPTPLVAARPRRVRVRATPAGQPGFLATVPENRTLSRGVAAEGPSGVAANSIPLADEAGLMPIRPIGLVGPPRVMLHPQEEVVFPLLAAIVRLPLIPVRIGKGR